MTNNEESGRSFQVKLETPDEELNLVCGEAEYVWDAAAREDVLLPWICSEGRCLTCAGRLLEGKVNQSAAEPFFPEDEAAGFVLLCRARPCSDLRIRTHQAKEMRTHRLEKGLPAPRL